MPVLLRDHVQHHVERSGAARAGETVAVDLEQFGRRLDLREILREAGEVLPMDRAAIAVQHVGARQDVAAGAQRADIRALAVGAAQRGEHVLVLVEMAVDAAAQHDGLVAADLVDAAFRRQLDPVAGAHRLGVGREQPPAIKLLAARPVGEPQWLDGRGEGDHREIRHQQERDFLRQLARLGSKHGRRETLCGAGSPRSLRRDLKSWCRL